MMNIPILSLIIFIPLIGGILVLFLPKDKDKQIKTIATAIAAIPVILTGWVCLLFDRTTAQIQFMEKVDWIPSFGISYLVGLDGLGLPMVIITTLLSLLSLTISWNIKVRVKEYFALFLILEAGMLGVFLSLDLFVFYIFWELVLIPMYFIIGVWGGPRRDYASMKFILYTLIGSLFMLLGFLGIYFSVEPHTFNMLELSQKPQIFQSTFIANIVFLALYVGFAVKIPVWPFHTWLPDAHVEAPTAGSVILAGVLLKMGAYGLLRVSLPILPEAAQYFAYFLAILGLINIIYGAFVAMAQTDLKKMIAYSSISHMGYVLLAMAALTPVGLSGALMQCFTHGIVTGSLFMLVGVIYDRAHLRDINAFGGIGKVVPAYTSVMGIAVMASLGLPGLAGFIGELLCFIGAFPVFPTITAVAVVGVLITAIYLLWMYRQVFFGDLNEKYAKLKDLDMREWISLAPLMFLIILVGLYPKIVLDLMNVTILQIVGRF
ncbi:MAG: NADH-quinone oxidoreductase subunit M [bacterium]|nr:NADH-quinone oxidoreductase subunit M [bacterium]